MVWLRGRVFATLKHMVRGTEQPGNGTQHRPGRRLGTNATRGVLPAFHFAAAIHNAHAFRMSLHALVLNEIDGIPSHAPITGCYMTFCVARMGFTGAVDSDYDAIEQLYARCTTSSPTCSACCGAGNARRCRFQPARWRGLCRKLPDALAQGLVTQSQIDARTVRQMLRMKFRAGLFENPYADGAPTRKRSRATPEARALAVEAARKTTILLKNDGALPLRADGLKTLAVIGPNAAIAPTSAATPTSRPIWSRCSGRWHQGESR